MNLEPILEVRNISYVYSAGTPFEHRALENVSFSLLHITSSLSLIVVGLMLTPPTKMICIYPEMKHVLSNATRITK